MDPSYYTVLGWTVVLGGGVASYFYYTKNDRQREFRGRGLRNNLPRAAAALTPNDSDTGRKRRREERARGGPAPRPQDNGTPKLTYDNREEKEDLSWARELQKKKEGTKLAAPTRAATRQKTVKQSSANRKADELSIESSAGGDADNDLSPAQSPAQSPALNGHSNDETPSGKDVSDMLEPAAPGPAVLKLTESTNPKANKPKQQPKKAVEQDTKKQRQNKKKAEDAKAQREADEKERRILLEKQRRIAREAEGRPAKNGLGIQAAPANNAWKASNHITTAAVPATNAQLLDTFANDDTTTTGSTAPTSVSSSPVQQSKKKWYNGTIPSEEDQIRQLEEEDPNAWSTVTSKKGKKTNKETNGAVQPVEVAS
jgi:hypothetical protein